MPFFISCVDVPGYSFLSASERKLWLYSVANFVMLLHFVSTSYLQLFSLGILGVELYAILYFLSRRQFLFFFKFLSVFEQGLVSYYVTYFLMSLHFFLNVLFKAYQHRNRFFSVVDQLFRLQRYCSVTKFIVVFTFICILLTISQFDLIWIKCVV